MPDPLKSESPLDSSSSTAGITLFQPHVARSRAASTAPSSAATTGLPIDLREQSTRRLRMIAATYSLVYLLADFLPSGIMGELPKRFAMSPGHWLPSAASIVMGIVVALLAGNARIPWERRVYLGLLFEVAGSYGIALAQYHMLPEAGLTRPMFYSLSPSWVGVWLVFYSIAVPAPPRLSLAAALASASAPPVVIGLTLSSAHLLGITSPLDFFLSQVFPYLMCVLLAYVGARVVYNLGKDVTRARELGSYRLEERLGQGGMGEVWRASHRLLARPAAIKFIRPETIAGTQPEEARLMLKRFEREARATASLTSAHTVNLYDFGVTDTGTFYYVMELLDGFDFDHLVRRFGPVPPARLVHLVAQACESLEEAHRSGLIHRDVKPANLYLCRSGARCDFVKVLDFGLVTHRQGESAEDTRLTMPNQAAGTPAYMPPEVASGLPVDGRADLYALGCVAYWLATGHHVFEGRSPYEIVSQHLHATPEPPSQRGAAGIPPELDAVILACLEKSPERRPADARTLARALRRVSLADRWTDEDAEVWWSTHLPTGAKTVVAPEAATVT